MNDNKQQEASFTPIPKERLAEILSILLPYGYSHYKDTFYTGVSPYFGSGKNIITVVYGTWGCPLSICIEAFDEDYGQTDALGYYKGIMKLIAPELFSVDVKCDLTNNVLDFFWSDDKVQENRFPARVTFKPFNTTEL